MFIILAQAETTGITGGQFASGVIAVIGVLLLPFVRDWMKDRREREDAQAARETQNRLANSFERTEERLGELVTHLAVQSKLNDDRHAANIEAIRNTCKAHCTNYQTIHGPHNPKP